MKRQFLLRAYISLLLLIVGSGTFSQDVELVLKEAVNLDRQLKENDALEKYKQVLQMDNAHITALVRCTEIYCDMGERQATKEKELSYYTTANTYAERAYAASPQSVESNYAMALINGKMASVEPDKKKVLEHVRNVKSYADNALKINPDHAKANYTLGMWHYKIENLSWAKKAAVKTFYGGLPEAKLESAILYMEKCRKIDPYFVPCYLHLAKANKDNRDLSKSIEVLTKLIKLPNRSPNDAALKAEGKAMLDDLQ